MSDENYVWQDREVRCDGIKNTLKLRRGEESFDTINYIEDSKANNGDIGTFIFSNLRLIWINNQTPERNLSIGYDTIEDFSEREFESKIKGTTKAIFLKCKSGNQRFEFSFNSISENAPNLYNALNNILKIYDTGRLYRDLKYKGNIINFKEKKLDLLIDEIISNQFNDISFVSSDNNYNGILIISNIRLVWFCNNIDNFNLSIPWIQMTSIDSKDNQDYGKLLVIKAHKLFGGNTYIFYSNNQNTINNAINEVLNLKTIYQKKPILGIDIKKLMDTNDFYKSPNSNKEVSDNKINTNSDKNTNQVNDNNNNNNNNERPKNKHDIAYEKVLENMQDDENEVENNNYINETANIYLLNDNKSDQVAITDIVFSEELGLAVQKLPEGVTIDSLWKLINDKN